MTWKHGASAYRSSRIKCRCDVCRRGNTERARKERAARWGKEPPKHGRDGYRNYGCKCETCRTGHAAAMLKASAQRRQERAQ